MLRDLAPDLTPMLDILFILLVFFMLTAGVVLRTLDVRLPAADYALPLTPQAQQTLLELHAEFYVLNGERLADIAALRPALRTAQSANPDHELIIAGDEKVAMGRLLRVLTVLRAEGMESANIVMREAQR